MPAQTLLPLGPGTACEEGVEDGRQVGGVGTPLLDRLEARIVQQVGAVQRLAELGPELVAVSAAPAEQGGGTRTVRFIAVDGPRWMLRGVIMGLAAEDMQARAKVIELFRDMVVVRGDQPMPPSELLQLQVPAGVAQNPTESTEA